MSLKRGYKLPSRFQRRLWMKIHILRMDLQWYCDAYSKPQATCSYTLMAILAVQSGHERHYPVYNIQVAGGSPWFHVSLWVRSPSVSIESRRQKQYSIKHSFSCNSVVLIFLSITAFDGKSQSKHAVPKSDWASSRLFLVPFLIFWLSVHSFSKTSKSFCPSKVHPLQYHRKNHSAEKNMPKGTGSRRKNLVVIATKMYSGPSRTRRRSTLWRKTTCSSKFSFSRSFLFVPSTALPVRKFSLGKLFFEARWLLGPSRRTCP